MQLFVFSQFGELKLLWNKQDKLINFIYNTVGTVFFMLQNINLKMATQTAQHFVPTFIRSIYVADWHILHKICITCNYYSCVVLAENSNNK